MCQYSENLISRLPTCKSSRSCGVHTMCSGRICGLQLSPVACPHQTTPGGGVGLTLLFALDTGVFDGHGVGGRQAAVFVAREITRELENDHRTEPAKIGGSWKAAVTDACVSVSLPSATLPHPVSCIVAHDARALHY